MRAVRDGLNSLEVDISERDTVWTKTINQQSFLWLSNSTVGLTLPLSTRESRKLLLEPHRGYFPLCSPDPWERRILSGRRNCVMPLSLCW